MTEPNIQNQQYHHHVEDQAQRNLEHCRDVQNREKDYSIEDLDDAEYEDDEESEVGYDYDQEDESPAVEVRFVLRCVVSQLESLHRRQLANES